MSAANNTVLIVSLSTFPKELTPCRYDYSAGGKTVEGGSYYYQQEPFPMYLKDRLKGGGEILMLCTPEVRERQTVRRGEEVLTVSPEEYFMGAVRALGLDDVRFQSVDVDQSNPSAAVSEVVGHLRARKQAELKTPEIWLGTNGGLRGLQLVLEAILFLLSVDGIRVEPDHVLSTRKLKEGRWELFPSAAEFRIFDFVSGIKEFMNYGRIDSLETFLRSNQELNDDSSAELMRCLREISIGIQFGSTQTFDSGLAHLSGYVRTPQSTANPYMELFRKTILDDFGIMLDPENCRITDKIRWCCRKGFWVQAYTLVESTLPGEFIRMGLIVYDAESAEAAKVPGWDGDPGIQLFNAFLSRFVYMIDKNPTLKTKPMLYINKVGQNDVSLSATFDNSAAAHSFREMLLEHSRLKTTRNELVHGFERSDASVENYRREIEDYIRKVPALYGTWARSCGGRPLLKIEYIG